MKLLISIFAWYGFVVTIPLSYQQTMKSITKNSMTVEWEIVGENMNITMEAPVKGWLAIGLNTKNQLTDTQLMIACVDGDGVSAKDFLVLKPGDYRPMLLLGAKDCIQNLSGKEGASKTTISFSIPIKAVDEFHYSIKEGESMYFLMAYSQEDNFYHHSIMRTSVKIVL